MLCRIVQLSFAQPEFLSVVSDRVASRYLWLHSSKVLCRSPISFCQPELQSTSVMSVRFVSLVVLSSRVYWRIIFNESHFCLFHNSSLAKSPQTTPTCAIVQSSAITRMVHVMFKHNDKLMSRNTIFWSRQPLAIKEHTTQVCSQH